MSSTRCWSRPGPCSASSPSTPAAGTAAARCWPPSSASGVVFGMDRGDRLRGRGGQGAAAQGGERRRAGAVAAGQSGAARRAARTTGSSGSGCCTTTASPPPTPWSNCCAARPRRPQAAVLGPKVMDWSDRDVILEAGLTHRHRRPPDHRDRAARGRPGPARRGPGHARRGQRRHADPARRVGPGPRLRPQHGAVPRGRRLLLAGARGGLPGPRHHRRGRLPRPGRRPGAAGRCRSAGGRSCWTGATRC